LVYKLHHPLSISVYQYILNPINSIYPLVAGAALPGTGAIFAPGRRLRGAAEAAGAMNSGGFDGLTMNNSWKNWAGLTEFSSENLGYLGI